MLGIGVNVVITESQMDVEDNFLSELSPTNEAISSEKKLEKKISNEEKVSEEKVSDVEKLSKGFFNF